MPTLTQANLSDLKVLTTLSRRTFSETFAHQNTAEDMALYLEKNMTEESLGNELMDSNAAFYLLKENETLCGYFKIEFGGDAKRLEIERLYIDQKFQKKGYGKMMMETIEKIAAEKNKSEIFLGVWQENHKAISFYQKCGFEIYDVHTFKLSTDLQKDWLMRKTVVPFPFP
ncbi:MAG: GNAT family N-acetyltransferase [Crocinitomicaceae bacterium]|nr:GNAT family N-acetyltransferase [Crocinitomicaceae bacterium]